VSKQKRSIFIMLLHFPFIQTWCRSAAPKPKKRRLDGGLDDFWMTPLPMNRVVPEKKIGNGKRAEAEVAPDDAAAVRSSQPRIQSQLRLYRYRGYNRNCGYTATLAIIATSVIQPLCQYGHGSR
jgi:hypothetical protein